MLKYMLIVEVLEMKDDPKGKNPILPLLSHVKILTHILIY